ncbi:PKD domain-containing protein [Flavobacterium sp.]|uniref:PKD domain-containing protein n=1 Tax=Flavobacterium sp. TaxID=239 RepID=UPI003A915DA9
MTNFTWQSKRLPLMMLILFGFLLLPARTIAQEAISIISNSETGCYQFDGPRKDSEQKEPGEDIEDGPCIRVCENTQVTYSLTGNSSNWANTQWNVAGGGIITSSLDSCLVQWQGAGNGTVTAEVTKLDGTVEYVEICIEIIPAPEAFYGVLPAYVGIPVQACLDEEIFFTNLSTTNGGSDLFSYYWDFGDGTYSSEFQPTHSYSAATTYTVILTVTNVCNCTSKYKMEVKVHDFPGINIECPSVVCDGEIASYTVEDFVGDICGGNFNWSVDGGTIVSTPPYGPTIDVVWDNVGPTGFGYVTIDATGCDIPCAGPTTIPVPVIQNNGTIVEDTVICENEQTVYKLPQWPSTTFNWSLDNNGTGATLVPRQQQNEIVVQTAGASGTITLSCTYNNTLLNCGGTAELVITIKPKAQINGPSSLCINTIGGYNLTGGYSGSWVLKKPNGTVVSTGSGNSFNYNFTTAGNYILTVSGGAFCKNAQMGIVVRPKETTPTAIIGPDESCPGLPVTYSVNNTIPGTVIVWDILNGSIAGSDHGDEVTVTFDPTGPYVVSAWRENTAEPNCPSEIITKTVILPPVDANITGADEVCSSSYASYETAYTDGESYFWSVVPNTAGSVTAGNGTNMVDILWNEPPVISNPQQVKLTVIKCGLPYDFYFDVDVISTPAASIISPATICGGDSFSVSLTGLTSGTATWDFGDGTTPVIVSATATVPHTYANINGSNTNYDISVHVDNPNGCSNPLNLSQSITVQPAPVASITPAGIYAVCPESAINDVLTVNIQSGFGSTSSIKWYHNGSLIATGPTSINLASLGYGYGSYYAIVANSNGCTTTTNTVIYNDNCDVTPCNINETVTVSATNDCGLVTATSTATGSPTGYTWFTQPAATPISLTPTSAQFQFDESGRYRIYYRAIYGSCAITKYYEVDVPYMADLKYNVTCNGAGGYDITLLDHSNFYPGYQMDNYVFNVDSGTVYSGPSNTFTTTVSPGIHTLDLTISKSGVPPCSAATVTIDLPAMPNATISAPNEICEDASFNMMLLTPQTGLTYLWNFGDGSTNRQVSPSKVYENAGTYNISLTVTNQYGCTDTKSHTIEVIENKLQGTVTAVPPVACEGGSSTLTYTPAAGSAAPTSYEWMEGNTVIGTTATNTFNVTQSGAYWVRVSGTYSCSTDIGVDNQTVVTFVKPTAAYISGPDEVCLNSSISLSTPEGPAGTEYTWKKNGSILTAFNNMTSMTDTATALTTYTYEVIVKTPNGVGGFCTETDTHTVTVKPIPGAPSISVLGYQCNPVYKVKLQASASGTGTFTWSNGVNGSVNEVLEGGTYQVRFTNEYGCSSTSQIVIPKDPTVYFWNVPSGCYELCKDILTAGSLGGINMTFPYWEWIFNGGTVDNGYYSSVNPLPLASFGDGSYSLILDNGYCHRESDPVDIKIKECRECEFVIRVKAIKTTHENGYCSYIVYFDLYNPYSIPIQVTLSLPNGEGMFVPSSITIPPGSSSQNVQMIPLNGFSGGPALGYAETTIDGKPCLNKLDIRFPDCAQGRPADMDDSMSEYELVIAPNPAKENVSMNFTYLEKDSEKTIQVYNLLGVMLDSYTPAIQNGTWELNTSRFPAGQYIVVMKENGNILMQKNLIIQ